MNKTKTVRQKIEYNRLMKNKNSWLDFQTNLSVFKKSFFENCEIKEYTWKQFYNMYKSSQLKCIRKHNFTNNKHKSVLMWNSLMSLILKFNNQDEYYNKDFDTNIQEKNDKNYNKIMSKISEYERFCLTQI